MIRQAIIDSSLRALDEPRKNKRIVIDLEHILPQIEGNIVEIGGGFGDCTVYFCNVAVSMNRKVLVIDPFESGWDAMPKDYQYPFEKFEAAVKGFEGTLILHKFSSQDRGVPLFLTKHMPIAFAFVDGLQTYAAVYTDLELMSMFKVKVICVDDRMRGDIPLAISDFLSCHPYKLVVLPNEQREAYLIHD